MPTESTIAKSFKNVNTLIIGAGGGMDIISVIGVISSGITGIAPEKCYPAVAKSKRTNITGPLSGLFSTNPARQRHPSTRLGIHLIQTHPTEIEPSKNNKGGIVKRWKSPLMEECLPRVGAEPYLILHGLKTQETISQASQELRDFCESKNIEQIIAVDNGGDILEGFENIENAGRDQRVLEAMKSLSLPILVMVISPGSDGDYSQVELAQNRNQFVETHEDLGIFALEGLKPTFRQFQDWMGANRTCRITLRSYQESPTGSGTMTVVRGTGKRRKTQDIPHKWIQSGWLFKLNT